MAKRTTRQARSDAYDSLIDAERDALIQSGRKATQADLIKALLEASDLSPRNARRAVIGFIERRGGFIPSGSSLDDARTTWIDDLLDAERANAKLDDRPVTRKTLIRAVRQASGLTTKQARASVEDYLHRRGGRAPTNDRRLLVAIAAIGLLTAAAFITWVMLRA